MAMVLVSVDCVSTCPNVLDIVQTCRSADANIRHSCSAATMAHARWAVMYAGKLQPPLAAYRAAACDDDINNNHSHLSEKWTSLVANVKAPQGCTDALRLATEPLRARSSSWKLHRLQPTELSLHAPKNVPLEKIRLFASCVNISWMV